MDSINAKVLGRRGVGFGEGRGNPSEEGFPLPSPMPSLLPRRREPGGGTAAVQDALEIGKDFCVVENEGGQGFH